MQRGLTVNKEERIRSLRLEYLSLYNDMNAIENLSTHSMSVLMVRLEQIRQTLRDDYGVSAR